MRSITMVIIAYNSVDNLSIIIMAIITLIDFMSSPTLVLYSVIHFMHFRIASFD